MSSDPQEPNGSPDFIVTYGPLTNNLPNQLAPINMTTQLTGLEPQLPQNLQNMQNTAINQVISEILPIFQEQNDLYALLGQLAVSNPWLVLQLLGFDVNGNEVNTAGVQELVEDAPAEIPNALGGQGLQGVQSSGSNQLFSNAAPGGPFGLAENGIDFSGANLLHFFPNITGQSPAAASSSSGPIRNPPRRRHRRRLVRAEDVEPPTDMVPDDEWQRKIVEYCAQSQLYRTWKHGMAGMDCLINPDGPKMFPQTVFKVPNNRRNLFRLVRHGERIPINWNMMTEEQKTIYRKDRTLLAAEVELQIQKGWIQPVKRTSKGKVVENSE